MMYVIYSGIEDKNVFVIVERSVAESKTLVNFGSLCCNMDMSIFFIVFGKAIRSFEYLEQCRRQ